LRFTPSFNKGYTLNSHPYRRPFQTFAALMLACAAFSAHAADDPLKKAAAEKGAVVTESGLVFLSLKEGSGNNPVPTDQVKVHYKGTFTDGREFDSSYKRGEPTTFPLNRVIKCWTEGVAKMKVGGKAKLTCPSAIAYGERGAGGGQIPGGATLVFEVELLAINGK
jgi:FKBP-type peptidyl-prolyl cis-trans isomerase FkpA